MAKHVNTTAREPAVITGTAVGVVTAILALLVSFGLDLADDQQAAILGVTAVVVPLVAGFLIRGKVTPSAEVVARVNPDSPAGLIVAGPASETPTGNPVTVYPAGPDVGTTGLSVEGH